MSQKIIQIAVLCALGIGGVLGVATIVRRHTVPPAAIPVVPAGNKVPDRFWLQDYQTLLDLQDEIAVIQKKDGLAVKNDQLRGLASRLNAEVPAGYTFDEVTRSFKPNVPLVPQIAPAPQPASAPGQPSSSSGASAPPSAGVKAPPAAKAKPKS